MLDAQRDVRKIVKRPSKRAADGAAKPDSAEFPVGRKVRRIETMSQGARVSGDVAQRTEQHSPIGSRRYDQISQKP
jgi:hypothetical protein